MLRKTGSKQRYENIHAWLENTDYDNEQIFVDAFKKECVELKLNKQQNQRIAYMHTRHHKGNDLYSLKNPCKSMLIMIDISSINDNVDINLCSYFVIYLNNPMLHMETEVALENAIMKRYNNGTLIFEIEVKTARVTINEDYFRLVFMDRRGDRVAVNLCEFQPALTRDIRVVADFPVNEDQLIQYNEFEVNRRMCEFVMFEMDERRNK